MKLLTSVRYPGFTSLLAAILLAGCGGGASSSPAPTQSATTQSVKLTMSPTSLPAGTYGQFYQVQFKASGGTTPYRWTALIGDLLTDGLTLNPTTGLMNGVLTTGGALTIMVEDATGHRTTQNFMITFASPPLKITTTVLPPATVGNSYEVPILTNNQGAPVTFALVSAPDSVPAGFIVGNQVFGTPSASGTYHFTISASLGSSSDQRDFTLVVRDKQLRNDSLATATPISNGFWDGNISPYADPLDTANPDQDFYQLEAEGGNYVSVSVLAEGSGDPLQGVMAIEDSSGTPLETCGQPGIDTDFVGRCVSDFSFDPANGGMYSFNPMLIVHVPGSGTKNIFLRVLDWRGDARPDMFYELDVHGAD